MPEREVSTQPEPPKNVAPVREDEQQTRGWSLKVNGVEVPGVSFVELVQSKMGTRAEYGKTEAGHDGLAIEETGGGGSVIVPYYIMDGELYVGGVEENRPNSGGKVWNVPRGFLDPGMTHFAMAQQELAEEAGFVPIEKRIRELRGAPMNPNSTYFVAKGPDKGVRAFVVAVQPSEVSAVQASDDPQERVFGFNPDVLRPVSPTGEKVMKSRFIHWTKALGEKDMFGVAATGRLVAEQFATQPKPTPAPAR
jgi:hypothetical protein